MTSDDFKNNEDYTKGKSFWKWYFSSKQNWMFGLFFNGMALFGFWGMRQDPPESDWFYLVIVVPILALWFYTIREYRQLKKTISK